MNLQNIQTVRQTINEGNDKAYRKALITEITACKAINARLNSVLNTAIFSSLNRIVHSKNLDRLNVMIDALRTTKENTRLNKIAQALPEYCGLQGIIEFNKQYKVFQCVNYPALCAIIANYTPPSVGFFDWLANRKAVKTEQTLTEEQASKRLRNLLIEMRKSPFVTNNDKFNDILTALHTHCAQYDKDYNALLERSVVNNIVNN